MNMTKNVVSIKERQRSMRIMDQDILKIKEELKAAEVCYKRLYDAFFMLKKELDILKTSLSTEEI